MSLVADFASDLHNNNRVEKISPIPTIYPQKDSKLYDIQVVMFDVYGTLINYWDDKFTNDGKADKLKNVFKQTSDYFGFTKTLNTIDDSKSAEETLFDFYHGLITIKHEESLKSGKTFPEVAIEEVWDFILSILIRNGYEIPKEFEKYSNEFCKIISYYYNFFALKRGFFDGVLPTLIELKKRNFKLGILSNAQFYTPIDLTLFIRDDSDGDEYVDYLELFDDDLCFFSYDYGIAKPNQILFRKLFDTLYELSVLPSQTVFVGNDLSADIKASEDIGLKTALFTGNRNSTFLHDLKDKVIPNISFTSFEELPQKLSFYTDKKS